MKVTIKAKDTKSFEAELSKPSLDERVDIVEYIHAMAIKGARIYDLSVKICRLGTNYTDEELDVWDNDQHYALARQIYRLASKKK